MSDSTTGSFGGPWSYDQPPRGEGTGADKEYLDGAMARSGAVAIGRNMYEAAEAWGGNNPFGVPLFVVTHRPEDARAEGGFTFLNGLDEAIARAREASGGKDVAVGGGADVIRQALRAGYLDEVSISIAPVILGGGEAPVRWVRRDGEPGAPAPAPVTVCHAHHLSRGTLTGGLMAGGSGARHFPLATYGAKPRLQGKVVAVPSRLVRLSGLNNQGESGAPLQRRRGLARRRVSSPTS